MEETAVVIGDISYYSHGHMHQAHHFVDCVLTNEEPRYSGADGVRAVQCALAAIRSAREEEAIAIADMDRACTAYG